jgi:hypothetical protein
MQPKAYAMMSAWQEISSADGCKRTLYAMRHPKYSWVHGGAEAKCWGEDGWVERTYANAYTNGWCDANADSYWGSVDGGLLVVLLFDYDLWGCRRGTGRRSVERGWRRVAVNVWVVGNVCEPGSARHLVCRGVVKMYECRRSGYQEWTA